ncbi:MAG: ABC transporter ATP-binding protein [Acidobacteria bacterium]|nr:MAG: ABC transporter ATP-binding protein [Acidobacteriota bacterium]
MHETHPAIETIGLRKAFGEKVAVEDLSLRVERGEVFGFLGPNGAGKTTSVKMLLGLCAPTAGKGFLLGRPVGTSAALGKVGFLPEHFRFHDWLKAHEFLFVHGRLYGMKEGVLKSRVPELLELVGLQAHAEKRLSEFSKGMLQRIGLAQALLNDPEVVFLDEPTSGLDPMGRRLVRDIIRDLKSRGTTVFLNSHLLSEVEVTCDRVSFVKHGRVVQTSPLKSLMNGMLNVEIRADKLTAETLEGLRRWTATVDRAGDTIRLRLAEESCLPDIHRFLVQQGADVYSLSPQRISLEELFVQIVGSEVGL